LIGFTIKSKSYEVYKFDNLIIENRSGICAYIMALFGGHWFVRVILNKLKPEIDKLENGQGIKGADAYIGFLERALVLTFVLLNQFTLIGLVLTAKSIARFEELKNRRFSEYLLVGTLASILFTIWVGVLVLWLNKLI